MRDFPSVQRGADKPRILALKQDSEARASLYQARGKRARRHEYQGDKNDRRCRRRHSLSDAMDEYHRRAWSFASPKRSHRPVENSSNISAEKVVVKER